MDNRCCGHLDVSESLTGPTVSVLVLAIASSEGEMGDALPAIALGGEVKLIKVCVSCRRNKV